MANAPSSRNWPATLAICCALAVVFGLGVLVLALSLGVQLAEVAWPLLVLLAAVPLCLVLPVFLWLDSFEREPGWLLVLAFGWGAVVATGFAMVANGAGAALAAAFGLPAEATATVVIAPFVEESVKGVFLLGLWWLRPRQLDGVVDGIVYAGVVAAGFAFVENLLYFSNAVLEGQGALTAVFVMRGLASPFAHPLFTACTGAAVGRAVLARTPGWRFSLPVLGWCAAVLLHGIWNSAVVLQAGWLLVYLLFEVPVFIAFLVFVVMVRRYELRHVTHHLEAYVRHGWLSPAEVRMVGDGPERRRAVTWAGSVGGAQGRRSMRRFQREAIRLAHTRARLDRAHLAKGPVGQRVAPAWERAEVAQQQDQLRELDRLRAGFTRRVGATT